MDWSIIVVNFDASLSSPDLVVSSHDMASIIYNIKYKYIVMFRLIL